MHRLRVVWELGASDCKSLSRSSKTTRSSSTSASSQLKGWKQTQWGLVLERKTQEQNLKKNTIFKYLIYKEDHTVFYFGPTTININYIKFPYRLKPMNTWKSESKWLDIIQNMSHFSHSFLGINQQVVDFLSSVTKMNFMKVKFKNDHFPQLFTKRLWGPQKLT